jgi:hypothetical protein
MVERELLEAVITLLVLDKKNELADTNHRR